jgi:hypothetical protein
MPDQFYNKRIRRVNKVIPYVAGGSDYVTIVGPTTSIGIQFHGTADNHTVEPSGGMPCAVIRCVVQTNRRGTIWDLSGVTLELLNKMFFNGEPKIDTTAGSVDDGCSWVLPFSLDAGEMATVRIDMGTLAQIAAAAERRQVLGIEFVCVSLDVLLGTKLHAVRYNEDRRGPRDFDDILALLRANAIDVKGERWRALCQKYGTPKVAERIRRALAHDA